MENEKDDAWMEEDPDLSDPFYVAPEDVLPDDTPDPVGPLMETTADRSMIPTRKPTRVVVHREDGTVFSPFNREMAEQLQLQQSGMTVNESREYDDAFDTMLRAIHEFQFTTVEEKEDGSTEKVTPDLSTEEGLQKLVDEHHYSVFKQSDEPCEALTSADLLKFEPGDFFEFAMVDLGLVGAEEPPSEPKGDEMEEEGGEDIDVESEEVPFKIRFADSKPTRRKLFAINPISLAQSKVESFDTYEIMNRVANLLLTMPVKTPFLVQLIQPKPWPVIASSTNLLRLYGSVVNLFARGMQYDVDTKVLDRNVFFNYAREYGLLKRKNEHQFLHYSHYQNYIGHESNFEYWAHFSDPFAEEVFSEAFDLRMHGLIAGSFDIWFDTVPLEWMTQVFPTIKMARDIMFHWYLRVWRCEYAPTRKDLDRMNDNDTNRRSIATGVTLKGLDRRVLRDRILCWCYYEMEFGILLTEYLLCQRVADMANCLARRAGEEWSLETWQHLSLQEERDFLQQLYRESYAATRDTLLHMEVYMLRRGLEGPDIHQNRWSFLTSPLVDLTLREESSEETGGKRYGFPLARYVSAETGNRILFSQYRDLVARRVLIASKKATAEGEEKYESFDVGVFTVEQIDIVGKNILLESPTRIVFDNDAIHQRENDGALLFAGCEWTEPPHTDASPVSVEDPIPWSPTMCVMRDYWVYLWWTINTRDTEIEKILTDCLFGQYKQIPDFVSVVTKPGDVPEVSALIEEVKESTGKDGNAASRKRGSKKAQRRRRAKAHRAARRK